MGVRGDTLGSQPVNRLFNQVGAEAFRLLISGRVEDNPDAVQLLVDLRLGALIDELRKAIRRELGTDRVPLDDPIAPVPPTNPIIRGAETLPPFDDDDSPASRSAWR